MPRPKPPSPPADDRPLCFVVQGFGLKTDYTDGRQLDLDASYDVIKEAVERAGLRCQRADEIVHAGTIDIPMYERLLHADLVIADLSTYNLNAAFELGVRYALRPRTTLVVAESKFKSPFDVNHIVIRRYEHLGPDLGAKEAQRFKRELAAAIQAVMAEARTDSPVYAMLPGLQPPQDASDAAQAAARPGRSAREWLQRAQQAMAQEDYRAAVRAWIQVQRFAPGDRQATLQLALATYRSRQPSEKRALDKARALLVPLEPAGSNDPETLGLWAAVHRRLWELEPARQEAFEEALQSYRRSVLLRPDHYLASHLGSLRLARAAALARAGQFGEAHAEWVLAERAWRDALAWAQDASARQGHRSGHAGSGRFWRAVTPWLAAIALGDAAAEKRAAARLRPLESSDWMRPTREAHGERVRGWRAELQAMLPAALAGLTVAAAVAALPGGATP
ncbi:tetratricopeptide repeat-containing protein [Ideonella sp.]|uniref:tetratricopeptide repeat-containing protein n=1 Tax=Ideonella sp. TaxID=1929293 RepID=UPI0035B370FA